MGAGYGCLTHAFKPTALPYQVTNITACGVVSREVLHTSTVQQSANQLENTSSAAQRQNRGEITVNRSPSRRGKHDGVHTAARKVGIPASSRSTIRVSATPPRSPPIQAQTVCKHFTSVPGGSRHAPGSGSAAAHFQMHLGYRTKNLDKLPRRSKTRKIHDL